MPQGGTNARGTRVGLPWAGRCAAPSGRLLAKHGNRCPTRCPYRYLILSLRNENYGELTSRLRWLA